jgi:hypothetical protein
MEGAASSKGHPNCRLGEKPKSILQNCVETRQWYFGTEF